MPAAKADAAAPRSPRWRWSGLTPLIAVVLGVAILTSLGIWQVQRLHWKEDLLARIAALQHAPPEPLSVVLNRIGPGQPRPGQVDFVRVQFACPTLQQTPTLHLYALLDGIMGYRSITACPLAEGRFHSLLVDRGFLPAGRSASAGPVLASAVVGVLRRPEAPGWAAPPDDPRHNDWRRRDIAVMAAALHAADPAPVFLELERPAPPATGPRPAALPTDIPNNHLGYALTWFGLAIGLAGVYVASLRSPGRS